MNKRRRFKAKARRRDRDRSYGALLREIDALREALARHDKEGRRIVVPRRYLRRANALVQRAHDEAFTADRKLLTR